MASRIIELLVSFGKFDDVIVVNTDTIWFALKDQRLLLEVIQNEPFLGWYF